MKGRIPAGLALTLLIAPCAVLAQTQAAPSDSSADAAQSDDSARVSAAAPAAVPMDPPAILPSASVPPSNLGGPSAATAVTTVVTPTVVNVVVVVPPEPGHRRRVSDVRPIEDRREVRRGVREIVSGLHEERRGLLLVDAGRKEGGSAGAALAAKGRALERRADYKIVRGEHAFVRGVEGGFARPGGQVRRDGGARPGLGGERENGERGFAHRNNNEGASRAFSHESSRRSSGEEHQRR